MRKLESDCFNGQIMGHIGHKIVGIIHYNHLPNIFEVRFYD